MLKSFNEEATKREVCTQIKQLEALIEEEASEAPATREGQEETEPNKTQRVRLPLSGRVIQAQGNSLKLACELIEAWGRQSKTLQTSADEPGSREE